MYLSEEEIFEKPEHIEQELKQLPQKALHTQS